MPARFLSELARYHFCNNISFDYCFKKFYGKRKISNDIVVSLTSTPKRIQKIEPTLNSLIFQTVQPGKILLNLPQKYRSNVAYDLPKYLYDNPVIEINRTQVDLGPAMKFIPTLRKFPKQNIIVVDDDQVYSGHMIENYQKKQKLYPQSALCLAGWKVPENLDHENKSFLRAGGFKIKKSKNIFDDCQVDIVQGASSYLINSTFFNDQIFDYSVAPRSAFYADDIWISGHLAKRRVDRMLVTISSRYIRLVNYRIDQATGLHLNENEDDFNNNEMYRYFASVW